MKYWIAVLLAGWLPLTAAGFTEDDLLPVDEAFAFEASASGPDLIVTSWNIADGYYLYKSKFRFATDAPGVSIGEPTLPSGERKHDDFFGDIETFRGRIRIEIPVQRDSSGQTRLDLKVTSQGCADIGVCYPPYTQVASLTLPEGEAPTAAARSGSALTSLSELGVGAANGDEDELLPADEAFRPSISVRDANTLVADWAIAKGYYLYREKFEFALQDAEGVNLLPAELPEGEHKHDEFFGDIQVYHDAANAVLPLRRTSSDETPLTLSVKYQGCAERGVCYPPISKTFELVLPAAAASAEPVQNAPVEQLSEQDAIAKRLSEGNLVTILLAFFGFGLLLAFTPCVFPMIPILSSIIVGQGPHLTVRRSFTLSLVYVLAMAATYTVAGVIAGKFGHNLQAAFQNPWVLSSFALVFVVLALAMFGLYNLQMPASVQGRLSEISNRQQGGTLLGVAIMGLLSALIVGPCVAAPLAGALIYIGQTGDAVLGGLALFSLSLGMGAPLLLVGIGAGKLLPRAGVWMDKVKAVFGVLMLAVAIWLVERILPASVTMALWAALLVLSAIYLGALDSLPVEATGWTRLWKGVGVLSLVYGVLLLIGAASGAHDPLRPLQGIGIAASGAASMAGEHGLAFRRIKTSADLDRELAAARERGQPVMVDFYADWCVSCKEMEKYTFAEPEVQQALSDMVLLQADVTANDEDDTELLKRFDLLGPPSILFYDASGSERPELRLVGFKDAEAFLEHLEKL
jgi:thiol:disulfide interchange protein DsbD